MLGLGAAPQSEKTILVPPLLSQFSFDWLLLANKDVCTHSYSCVPEMILLLPLQLCSCFILISSTATVYIWQKIKQKQTTIPILQQHINSCDCALFWQVWFHFENILDMFLNHFCVLLKIYIYCDVLWLVPSLALNTGFVYRKKKKKSGLKKNDGWGKTWCKTGPYKNQQTPWKQPAPEKHSGTVLSAGVWTQLHQQKV